MKQIRLLNADEIEVRVSVQKEMGCSLLLYKDARCDMRLLDETFGAMNWQRSHEVIDGNLYCTVSVWDEEKKQWISKQDVGTENRTEKEKSKASDSFKRACFNFGIGRELYTAPFIWVALTAADYGKDEKLKANFSVQEIGYNSKGEINHLIIIDSNKEVRFSLGKQVAQPKSSKPLFPSKQQDEVKFMDVAKSLYAGTIKNSSGNDVPFTIETIEKKYTLTEEVKQELIDEVLKMQ